MNTDVHIKTTVIQACHKYVICVYITYNVLSMYHTAFSVYVYVCHHHLYLNQIDMCMIVLSCYPITVLLYVHICGNLA